jgi:protein SCO1/2
MNYAHLLRGAILAALLATGAVSAAPPGNSLYQLNAALTDAAGQHFALRDMAGGPVLVTMFYGDCNAACPIIIETLKRTVDALGPAAKPLRVLMISLDPLHDSPAGLAMQLKMHQLDPARFRLAVARDETQTRTLAHTLNIKFRTLDSGEINHTTRIVLLDAAGTQQASSSRLDAAPDPVFVKQIAALLKNPKTGSDQGIPK